MTRASLFTFVFVALAACGNEDGKLSLKERFKCASETYKDFIPAPLVGTETSLPIPSRARAGQPA